MNAKGLSRRRMIGLVSAASLDAMAAQTLAPNGTPAGAATGNTATVSTDQFHGGAHSLKLAHTTTTGRYVRSAQVPLTGGNTHVASVYVRGAAAATGWVYLEFSFRIA